MHEVSRPTQDTRAVAPRGGVLARVSAALVAVSLGAVVACHPGPVTNTTEMRVGGTIAGNVTATGTTPVPGRRITATNVASRATFDATTGTTGGYTIKVPEGTYRLDIELRPGETVSKRPDDTEVNTGDLDPGRDFDLTVVAAR